MGYFLLSLLLGKKGEKKHMYQSTILSVKNGIGAVLKNADGDDIQKIFSPFISAYEMHSISILAGGLIHSEGVDFLVGSPFIEWKCCPPLEDSDNVQIIINYFYKASPYSPDACSLAGLVIDKTLSSQPSSDEVNAASKRKEILAKHFIDGLFALDNGLYKESVLNFGTVLEVILNSELAYGNLSKLIKKCNIQSLSNLKNEMDFIAECRNKIHAEQLKSFEDVSRGDAIQARGNLIQVLCALVNLP